MLKSPSLSEYCLDRISWTQLPENANMNKAKKKKKKEKKNERKKKYLNKKVFCSCAVNVHAGIIWESSDIKLLTQSCNRLADFDYEPKSDVNTLYVPRTRHAGHCSWSRDELIRDALLWTPTHGQAKAGRPARTYIQQLCEDTGCCPEDLPRATNDREKWRERVRDIHATSATWWWWWWWCSYYLSLRIRKEPILHYFKVNPKSTFQPQWVSFV